MQKRKRSGKKTKVSLAALFWFLAICVCVQFFPEFLNKTATRAELPQIELREEGKVRICFWNLKNYLETYKMQDGVRQRLPKPESEKEEILKTLQAVQSDVLAIAEIGGTPNLKEFQEILKSGGLEFPYTAITDDSVEFPQCAILSKMPIKQIQKLGKGKFEYFFDTSHSPRGLLLAQFETDSQTWFLGVLHLKSRFGSKKKDPEFAIFRKFECIEIAKDLKPYMNEILLLVGDFNDEAKNEAPRVLASNKLLPIKQKDGASNPSYVWQQKNIPYVFDFFLASKKALSDGTTVLPINRAASDHAPIFTDLSFSKN